MIFKGLKEEKIKGKNNIARESYVVINRSLNPTGLNHRYLQQQNSLSIDGRIVPAEPKLLNKNLTMLHQTNSNLLSIRSKNLMKKF